MQGKVKNEAQEVRYEVEDLTQVKKKINITVPAEAVTREFNSSYATLKSNAAVSGFRKGAVPKSVLKARYGESVTNDVAANLVERNYSDILGKLGLSPVDRPEIDMDVKNAAEGKDFSFSVTVEIPPTVEVDGYLGMELEKEKIEVTDKDVEDGLERLRNANAQFKDVEREAKDGDMVVVDFEATVDGKPVKALKAEGFPFIIGQNEPLPGFNAAVTGLDAGGETKATIKVPENISEKDIAGRDAEFTITLKALKEKALPELDDDFAKDMECESLDDLKGKVRDEIRNIQENHAKERLKDKILDRLIETHSFDVPDSMVNRYHAILMSNVLENIRAGKVAPTDKGLNPDQLREKYRPEAVRRAQEDIILDTIAAREKVEVSKEEVEAAIQRLADSRGMSFDQLMSGLQREGTLNVIIDGLKHEKVFDRIIDESKAPKK